MAGQKGRSGRPKKSTALKIAQGTYRSDRDAPEAPVQIESDFPPAPDYLTLEARQEWDRLTSKMVESGRLLLFDYPMWCELWAEYGRMRMVSSKDGGSWIGEKVQEFGDPYYYVLPEYTIHKDARSAFVTLAAHFGLSPRTRLGIHAPIEDTRSTPQSGMREFLGG